MFGHFQKQVTAWYGRLKINAGTTKAPALEIAQTWNDASYTGTAIKTNVTDTASTSGSMLMDLQVGGVSKFNVRKEGTAYIPGVLINNDNYSNLFSFVNTNTWGVVESASGANYKLVFRVGNSGSVGQILGLSSNRGIGIGEYAPVDVPPQGLAVPGKVGIATRFPSIELTLSATSRMGWDNGSNNADLILLRDNNSILAQRNGINPQESRLYGSYTSDTAYQRLSTKTLREAVTAASGASVTTTISIPKYTHLIGVTTRVSTALGTGNGTTGYTVGDGTDADLWGAITGTAQGTTSDRRDFTAVDALGPDGADRTITLTAVGGNFDGTGIIEVCAFYLAAEAD